MGDDWVEGIRAAVDSVNHHVICRESPDDEFLESTGAAPMSSDYQVIAASDAVPPGSKIRYTGSEEDCRKWIEDQYRGWGQ
jgi:hypothetical protein